MAEIKDDAKIQDGRFQVSDFMVNRFDAQIEPGITREQLLRQEYWSHVAGRVTPYSEITARWDDGSHYAKLLVLDSGPGWVKVQILHWWDLDAPDTVDTQSTPASADDFEIIYKGAKLKHIVLRKSDQKVIHEGEARKSGAEEWLRNYIETKVHKKGEPATA